MPKFNTRTARTAPSGRGPIVTEDTPGITTHEGGQGYARDAKGELFLLAVSNFVGEDTFYEKAGQRDARFETLVHRVAVVDPAWMLGFIGWLRSEANMRSASLVAAAESVKARLDAKVVDEVRTGESGRGLDPGFSRSIIDAACQRADEPGELLAYWLGRYGRRIPKPVKRGLGDAARRLYREYSLLKYDTASHGVRFADVLDLTHPSPATPWQGELFKYALDRRHGRDDSENRPEGLSMITANAALRSAVAAGRTNLLLDPDRLGAAGMTWEDALSLAGSNVDKAKLWEAMIPSMGYMALLRNLRNFDEAGISRAAVRAVADRLADPAQVAKSRQLPFRFWSAYQAVNSDTWKPALGDALDAATVNVPTLPGRNLVLIDTSASMTNGTVSAKSTITPAEAAAIFGIALGKRCGADVYGFADGHRPFKHVIPKGASVLSEVGKFVKRTGEDGHGTNIHGSLQATYAGHDRVFILSDMQTVGGQYGTRSVPPRVRLYGFNLQGYRAAAFNTRQPGVYELGGMSDKTFALIPMLERDRDAPWPWEVTAG